MKKIMPLFLIGILVCMLLTVPVSPAIGLIENNKTKTNNIKFNEDNLISLYQPNTYNNPLNGKSNIENEITNSENYGRDEVVDQQQTTFCYYGWGVYDNQWIAQSFKPCLNVITKVELYLFKQGIVDGIQITVSIRDSLNGGDLTSISVDATIIHDEPWWIEFDFANTFTTPGKTYYIVTRGPEIEEGNGVYWGYNKYNPYENGEAWCAFSPEFDWHLLNYSYAPECDCCFKTYGWDDPPNIPTIEGATKGTKGIEYNYTFSTTDYEGHDVYFYINWGDDTTSGWIGPYSSGQQVTVAHKWHNEGKYLIEAKAKDTYGEESDWGTLEVTMPRSKATSSSLLLRFLERYPLLNRLLQRINIL